MKVIFLEDVPNVAKAGDIKEVSDGYGRNFLLPKKLAVVSQPGVVTNVKAQIESRTETEKLKKLAAELDGKEITFYVKMGSKDRMHGSITAANIATELQNLTDKTVDKRKIELEEPIKQLGSYDIAVKLAKDIEAKIKVNITDKEKEPEAAEAVQEPENKAE
jgi:large subunit ribosomal protein L9